MPQEKGDGTGMFKFTSKHKESGHGIHNNSQYHDPAYYDDPDYHEDLDEYSSDYSYDPDDYNRYRDEDIE